MGKAKARAERTKVQILKRFDIARYPVTVAEFAQFVEDGGYDDLQWWDGTRDLIEGNRLEPVWWDVQESKRNHPVTGVSWYEAKAYCRWRTAQERAATNHATKPVTIRLLSEAEWEFVARGGDEDRPYPWGPEKSDLDVRANYYYGKSLRGTTPVGLYPHGATPEGVLDMAGNVLEWVEDAEVEKDKETLRVLRGGSYYSNAELLRCGARWVGRPGDFNLYVGLRVAREV